MSNSLKTFSERTCITRAASRLVAYYNGYLSECTYNTIERWHKSIHGGIYSVTLAVHVWDSPINRKLSHVDHLEKCHPGYVHYLFEKTLEIKGNNTYFLDHMERVSKTVFLQES